MDTLESGDQMVVWQSHWARRETWGRRDQAGRGWAAGQGSEWRKAGELSLSWVWLRWWMEGVAGLTRPLAQETSPPPPTLLIEIHTPASRSPVVWNENIQIYQQYSRGRSEFQKLLFTQAVWNMWHSSQTVWGAEDWHCNSKLFVTSRTVTKHKICINHRSSSEMSSYWQKCHN